MLKLSGRGRVAEVEMGAKRVRLKGQVRVGVLKALTSQLLWFLPVDLSH